jgi:hypothetical protein
MSRILSGQESCSPCPENGGFRIVTGEQSIPYEMSKLCGFSRDAAADPDGIKEFQRFHVNGRSFARVRRASDYVPSGVCYLVFVFLRQNMVTVATSAAVFTLLLLALTDVAVSA